MKRDNIKIGAKVRIRRDLILYDEYGGLPILDSMYELRGKSGIITDVGDTDERHFSIDIDPIRFSLTYEMLDQLYTFKYGK